ncbi:MAG: 1-acyl-sn-glycerol-3-phosphate acyltransferase [Cyclobacteriaceae bacterium]
MIYRLLRFIVKIALRFFFRKITISDKANLPENGPLIIVVNHPNTFMDPLIVASLFKRKVGFLGNASIFVNGIVNAIFSYFNVIPVYRQQDVKEGVTPDNTDTFRDCNKYLSEGNALMIFPEGSSFHELRLRKIKTGTARIALSTENQHNFNLGIKILPVGLYYSNPSKFRSKIHVNVAEPFGVNEFKSLYESNSFEAVQDLTEKIEKALIENTVNTSNDEQEELFIDIKRIYKHRMLEKSENKGAANEEYRLTRELANAIKYFQVANDEMYSKVKDSIKEYISIIDENHLVPLSDTSQGKLSNVGELIGRISYAVISFPLYLFGVINNFLPYKIPYWLARKITREVEYHAPIMLTVGILIFPPFYLLLCWLFNYMFSPEAYLIAIYVLILPLSGYFSLHYLDFLEESYSFYKLSFLSKRDAELKQVEHLAVEIQDMLDEARETYLKRL